MSELSPQDRVQADLKEAMKAGDRGRISTLRLFLNRIKNERIALGHEIDEPTFQALAQKAIKQHKEAAEAFRKGDREERAAAEEAEAEILASYLPPPVDEATIRAAIEELVSSQGLSGPQAIGPVMREMTQRFAGRADGATINRIARDVLS
ncbi:MAG: GatB/YqeY domain-containing protein [Thermoanaerobaculia bacterium]